MNILIIGSGGREHAIAWKLASSPHIEKLYCAPGNAGIAELAKCIPADINGPLALAALAESIGADLTVIGPEAPLVGGVAEAFRARGLGMVGPTSAAARLEGSKIFAKQFMDRHGIPTARFKACDSPESARAAFNSDFDFPIVVKADGLAAGKGVRIANSKREFDEAINAMMVDRVFGEAGSRIVLEECLTGQEASVMLFTDGCDYRAIAPPLPGKSPPLSGRVLQEQALRRYGSWDDYRVLADDYRVLAPARDYKRVFDGDAGPNTGGMGSFSTPDLIFEETSARVTRKIVEPTLGGMASEGNPFSGILYIGLMFTEDGPKVIEYNARLGDPETQAVMMRLDSDLVEVFNAIIERRIGTFQVNWSNDSSVCIVAASRGYPGAFAIGKPITGVDEANSVEGVVVFHSGTVRDERGNLLTAGGRVLGVTARASTLQLARERAYEAVGQITFDGIHYRTDIASRRFSR